ncbi:MAG: pseudouridine synthase [Terracidiphilus sp.]
MMKPPDETSKLPGDAEPKLTTTPEAEPKLTTAPENDAAAEMEAGAPEEVEDVAEERTGAHTAAAETEAGRGSSAETGEETGSEPRPHSAARLERLQKILAQAGVASRRHAEELIAQGRVQVNGKVVTEQGTKADASRDHIRVDGKLIEGAERLRYFVLNKPKGYVTTVSDPEGRPTVMRFFEKMKERLYPVGRLDYMSEGLLVVTNDGELANRLTRASSGVEKTYLVKVAGQPTEAQLDVLRGGVSIDRSSPGSARSSLRLGGGPLDSGRVRTAPALIRQVRQGENPWFEVVLVEGRNRELRKMFGEIGHFVEKIRRVGYGPLVLDQEPGRMRELEPEEIELLRKAADGKLRASKSRDLRRRKALDAQLPTVAPQADPVRPAKARRSVPSDAAEFTPVRSGRRPARPVRSGEAAGSRNRPATNRYATGRPEGNRSSSGAARPAAAGANRSGGERSSAARPSGKRPERPQRGGPERARTGSGRPGRPGSFPNASKPHRSGFAAPEPSPRSGAARPFDGGAARRSFRGDAGEDRGARPRPFRAATQRAGQKERVREGQSPAQSGGRAVYKAGPGGRPKTGLGGPGKFSSGKRTQPGAGIFSKSGQKSRPSRPKTGDARPRSGAKRPGEKRRG